MPRRRDPLSARWREADRLFAAALELPPGRRAGFLAKACDGDDGLHGAVRALLAEAMEGAGTFEGPGDALLRAVLRAEPGGPTRSPGSGDPVEAHPLADQPPDDGAPTDQPPGAPERR